MLDKLNELTLLVWLFRCNGKDLKKALSEYTGCNEEVYTEKVLIEIEQNAIIDISRKYHIKGLFYEYFSAKKRWEDCASLFPKKYAYSELDALDSALLSIKYKEFDDEDQKRIADLKSIYVKK